jgi:hypothetical protein
MGAIYEATCSCGYKSGELTAGCGFQRICWNLAPATGVGDSCPFGRTELLAAPVAGARSRCSISTPTTRLPLRPPGPSTRARSAPSTLFGWCLPRCGTEMTHSPVARLG